MVDAPNEAQAELEAAQSEQARQPAEHTISRADVYAMIDYLGDAGAAITRGDPARLQKLYEALSLEIIYDGLVRRGHAVADHVHDEPEVGACPMSNQRHETSDGLTIGGAVSSERRGHRREERP